MRNSTHIIQLKMALLAAVLSITCTVSPLYAQGISAQQAETGFGDFEFSQDDNLAYLEAIEFCLAQIGSPVVFDENTREAMLAKFRQVYSTLPHEVQYGLANARQTWTHYQATWDYLSLDEQKEFAYDVLSLAYGEEAAAEALGMTEDTNTQSYDEVMDDFCIHNPGACP